MPKIIYHYCYRIDFSDGFFYIGSRRSRVIPKLDARYMGSPVTHKAKWNDSTLTKMKTILKEDYSSFEEMREHEMELIRHAWETDMEHCLNERCGGFTNPRISSKVGQRMYEERRGIFSLTPEEKRKAAVKGGKIGGSIGRNRGTGIHSQTKQEKHVMGMYSYLNGLGAFALTPEEQHERSKKGYSNGLGLQSKQTLSKNGINGRRKYVEQNSPKVIMISPEGIEYPNQIMPYFCKDHDLSYGAMRWILQHPDTARPHKGWRARYQNPDH